MKWFRSNIKHGSRLALLALALQLALSFGHFHTAAQAAPAIQSAQPDSSDALAAFDIAVEAARQPASTPDTDQQKSDACAICAVVALAGTVLFATPPILLLPQAVEFPYLTADAEFVDLNPASAAFQPRAPPAS